MSRDGVPVGELSATNDPIPHANKRLLVQLYQAHPLLKTILDQASGKKVGEWVTAVDPAHGLDHSAVTVFEKQPDGSLTMVASEMRAELRPPAECVDRLLHWVQNPRGPQWIAQWYEGNWYEGNKWRLTGSGDWCTPKYLAAEGYRYLGPAECPFTNGRETYPTAQSPEMSVLGLRAVTAEQRVAQLETENAALRTERDYERARYARIAPPLHLGPRAHDLGVPTTPRTVGELMGWSASSKAEDPHPTNPTDEVHEAVERVIGHIADGKVTKTGRTALRGALDKAETPPTGRAASDAAIGRIARLR